ncbi:hypothetical protein HMJ29_11665 [Hymenobacter taeanensis]|uniref:Glycosyltransferase family 2 protein n=1 Tax=Hymenobacter taeanensis TaxID=2735321 RepID=A0A6M6BGB3_9BACT|nr:MULTISPECIES: hypothetical protein [Hymenobacter]QJX47561.1 hypothetical protein HMJ29_11665 [Hymenobacter taeanensis]UOQ82955.1 hypothetical protein MUN83_09420 [Hymenobacter sp. 5414T-23]
MSNNQTLGSVTFETKCYEKDWRFLLREGLLQEMVEKCNFKFDEKVLMINNVNDYIKVSKAADILIGKGVIDKFYIVKDYEKEVLDYFDLAKDDFKGGYYYSIAELTSIYLNSSDYLLHFSSDARVVTQNDTVNWIERGLKLLAHDESVITVNPAWNYKYDEAKYESFSEDEDWFYSYGFSDQCYLIRLSDFKKHIYKEYHADSEKYPAYGGELFEKRIYSYMKNKNLIRATSKHVSYIHENFPKNAFRRFIKLRFGR